LEIGHEVIRVENISKTFPGVKALDNVRLTVKSGEVHALVGENGAGKSTLIKILTGAHQMDHGGSIYLHGQQVQISSPAEAKSMGIGAVYQDVMMAPHLSVGENFFLGKLPRKSGIIDWDHVYKKTSEILKSLDIDVNPRLRVKDLTIGLQEMVSIAKIIHEEAKVIIFDEPTALLATEEVELLFRLIRQLKDQGCAIIYISHRMEEIFTLCDTVTVLKDGGYVDTVAVSSVDENSLIAMMVGRKLEDMYNIEHGEIGEVALEVRDLKRDGVFESINFSVRKGEIFGLYGLVGAGRTEVMRCITGADKRDGGEILIHGKSVNIRSPKSSIEQGIAFLTEDRKHQGLGMNLSIKTNTNLASYKKISRLGVVNLQKEIDRAEHFRKEIRIKTPSINQLLRNLSGGNQQKVVIAKWLACESDIFIFDEPTVGVDVGAKVEIYHLVEDLLRRGAAVIIVSSYLPEVMGLADRILVMSEGRPTGIVERSDFAVNGKMNEEMLVRMASGIV